MPDVYSKLCETGLSQRTLLDFEDIYRQYSDERERIEGLLPTDLDDRIEVLELIHELTGTSWSREMLIRVGVVKIRKRALGQPLVW